MVVRLPVEVVEEIISLHRQGLTISQITTVTGRDYRTVRRQVDPEFKRDHNKRNVEKWRERRKREALPRGCGILHRNSLSVTVSAVPTLEMLEQAYRRSTAPRTTTSAICGDPAPGQSALDRRNG